MAQSGAVPPSGPDAPAASAKRERTDHPAAAALESKGGTTPAATTPEAAPGAAPAANASANGATVAATVPAPVPGKLNLHIQGRVTTLSGDPVQSADVQVDIGVGSNPVRSLETNLQGGFETDYVLDPVLVRNRSLSVTAIKEGLEEGFERTDFAALGNSWTVDLVMGETRDRPDQLPLSTLTSVLTGRASAAPSPAAGPDSGADWRTGIALLKKEEYASAVPPLTKVADHNPNCVECRAMLGLALLGRGSWSSARGQLEQAASVGAGKIGASDAAPFVILGAIENWRKDPKSASDDLAKAIAANPHDGLALEEVGRARVLEANWAEASDVLAEAIKDGAPPEAHLLRARAMLAQDKAAEAQAEMTAYLGGRSPRDLPPELRAHWSEMTERLELENNAKTKTVVDLPLPQLLQAHPELNGLEPATAAGGGPDRLDDILAKAGQRVEAFFRNLPNTSSREQIREEHLQRSGKVSQSVDQAFEYLCLARVPKSGPAFEEYRTEGSGGPSSRRGLSEGLMLTSGFAASSLPFHPMYQPDSVFRYLGRQSIDGRPALVVAFAQRPEKARLTGSFRVNQTFATTLTQGIAWIDPNTYHIVQMRTDLLNPVPQVQLQRETTQIQFQQVRFKEVNADFWLPQTVSVTVEWRGKLLRNTHQYSQFKMFKVDTSQKQKEPKPSEADSGLEATETQQ